jgi:hypothetical protein
MLPAGLAARVLDEDAAHGLGGGGEEMTATAPARVLRPDQPQIRLVHQGRRLERLAGLLLRQLLCRQLAQLVVNQGQKSLGRLRLTLLDRREDAR